MRSMVDGAGGATAKRAAPLFTVLFLADQKCSGGPATPGKLAMT
jgi:hypothetical protein